MSAATQAAVEAGELSAVRDYLIKKMSEGGTSSEEQTAIAYLRGL